MCRHACAGVYVPGQEMLGCEGENSPRGGEVAMLLLRKQISGILGAPTFGFYSGYPWHVLTL